MLLNEIKRQPIAGTDVMAILKGGMIKLLFQPGEEILPVGATLMINEGAMNNPKPEAIFGQYVINAIESGKIGIQKGKMMASMDELRVIVHGKGGHGAVNVIPDQVTLEGTFRTLDEIWRSDAHERMIKMACVIAESMGGHCDFKIDHGYPVLVNDPKLTGYVEAFSREYPGDENVVEVDFQIAAEDFAYYGQVTKA